jgi:hypothetical protein
VGASLLLNIGDGLRVGAEGEKTINKIISENSSSFKDIKIKVGIDNGLTKDGLHELTKNILNCKYLSRLSFDITDKTDDLKALLPKIKALLHQSIKDKKQIVVTHCAALSKQFEGIQSHLSPDMLQDVVECLMKDTVEPLQKLSKAPATESIQKIPNLSDSSFNEDEVNEEELQSELFDQNYGGGEEE